MAHKKSYEEVSVDSAAASAQTPYRVLLDGAPARTPNGAVLAVPSRALAEAIAEEWRSQDKIVRPKTMELTRLVNTAIDRVTPDLHNARQQTLAFAKSDVLCYRAEAPLDLVQRQQRVWDPLLSWCAERFGASLRPASGMAYIEQDEAAIGALDAELKARDAFYVAALFAASALCGSLVIALAIANRRLDTEAALSAASLDKIYQAERWGWDSQEQAKVAAERAELIQISRFFDLLEK
jgi:chaperone required for assembly of F1-ATPase